MNKTQYDTACFLEKAGQTYNVVPTEIPAAARELHSRLILEEALETIAAMGVEVATMEGLAVDMDSITFQAGDYQDLVEIADGLADLQYVTNGAATAFGIDLQKVHNEVQRSNMSKFIDGHRADNGKWIKGPSYSPADVKTVLEDQPPLTFVSVNKALHEAFKEAAKEFWLSESEEKRIADNLGKFYNE